MAKLILTLEIEVEQYTAEEVFEFAKASGCDDVSDMIPDMTDAETAELIGSFIPCVPMVTSMPGPMVIFGRAQRCWPNSPSRMSLWLAG